MSKRHPSHANNSEDEDETRDPADFVSFPTIPDPEQDNAQTLTRMFTKTLRKVTTNASNLVSNYAYTSPKAPNASNLSPSNEANEHRLHDSTPDIDDIDDTPVHLQGHFSGPSTITQQRHSSGDAVSPPTIPHIESREPTPEDVTSKRGPSQASTSGFGITAPYIASKANISMESVPLKLEETFKNRSSTSKDDVFKSKPAMNKTDDIHKHRPIQSKRAATMDDFSAPRVTSDNKSLRLSTLNIPSIPVNTSNNSVTSSIINVNALVAPGDVSTDSNSSTGVPKKKSSGLSGKGKTLQSKISSIFNNLPNDIELSDDSGSDSETINNSSTSNSPTHNHGLMAYNQAEKSRPTKRLSSSNHHPSCYDITLYSESTAKSSPIKAELKRSYTNNSLGDSPTLSTIYALRSKDQHGHMKKKTSSNLSTVLFDNAKSIINNNLAVNVTSSTPFQEQKKKKKRPKRSSENPLKNGGIPRKYWMNNSFVSDCLNCFKPFTAFRRKHHCRFCGQIFCSDCTLFISYNQHKEERKNQIKSASKKSYHDKLRVCKPCYSDVIVYLSDDSSSSSDSETENELAVEEYEGSNASISKANNSEDTLMPNHPLSRIRSLSINSRRDSMMNEQGVSVLNKSFLNKESTPTMDSGNSIPAITTSPYSGVSSSLNNSKAPIRFANENIVVYPRQAPQMAIPTTRTGEAVEIPLSKNSYSGSNISINNTTPFGTVNSATNHHHHHHHHHQHFGGNSTGGPDPYNFYANGTNKSRFKSYAQLRVANMSSPDLSRKNSYDNISNMYSNLMGRKVSNNKLRNNSNSEKDLRVLKNRDSQIGLSGSERELDDDGDEVDSEDSQDGDNESEIEDEQAMSLYTLLNHQGFNNGQLSPKPTVTSNIVMPTLGEFPSMVSDKIFPGGKGSLMGSKLFQSSNSISTIGTVGGQSQKNYAFAFLEELPKSESLRSRERAHASIERMRSRRKTKSTRNISILTQNNNRLPSVESQSHKLNMFKYSPSSTPTSPKANPLVTIPLLGQTGATRSLDNDKSLILPSDKLVREFQPEKSGITLYDAELSPTAERGNTTQDYSELDNSEFDQAPNDSVLAGNSEYEDLISSFSKDNTRSKEEVYQELLDFVLKQSLEDCDIRENQELWMATLKKSMDYINAIKLTDTLDVRQYVKIKKILGGKIEETRVIDGLFMTKNIDSKRMSFSVNNPKIALLMFPIEYLKQKEQFISLRIIHSQQSVYITNLVSRLVSMEPDIVVVGDSVCGLAESLLEEAGVTVISNTKPQVIERISRYTKADIFQSVNDLFFKKGQLGTCGKFEVKKFIFKNTIKTFSFFIGNEIESGFTIALRGGDEDLLNSVKYAAETLLPGFLNAKFEKSLFDNHLITFLKADGNEKVIEHNDKLRQIKEDEQQDIDKEEEQKSCEFSLDSTEVVNYVKLFNERKISLSPATKFSLPTPLVNVIDSYYNFHNFFKRNQIIQCATKIERVDEAWITDLKINLDISKLPNKEQDQLKYLRYTSDLHLKSLVNEYHSRARVWSNCMGISSYQLYPVFHKNIHVLHSTVSIKHATPCLGPNIVVIDYYTDNDKCLGLFLDQSFQDSTKMCEECGESMLNHYKTYVHGNAKLDLILEKFESITAQQNYEGKNQRVMWSYCKECSYSSPIVSMNDETYYLSIGKFLELCFYGENVVPRDHACDHDFFKSHIRCFGFNDLVIRLEYSSIENYEVVVPKKQLEFMPEVDINLKIESFNSIKSKSSKFFQSISKRLNRVKVDTFDKAEDGLQKIEELKQKLDSQVSNIEFKTLDIYNSTLPTNHLSLNFILRELQELGVDWDNEFNEFEKSFLPSELEINKITQFHLRNFLMDRETDSTKEDLSKSDEISKDEKKQEPEEKSVEISAKHNEDSSRDIAVVEGDSKAELADAKPLSESLNHDKTREIGKLIPSSLYQESIMDRISKIEQLLENERNGGHLRKEDLKKVPPPQPLRHLTRKNSEASLGSDSGGSTQSTPNKVYQLANLFNKMNIDKISMEFKRQREQELKRKSHKFKALPIVESKPIVEIYDKIEDVVDVNDEQDRNNSITQSNPSHKRSAAGSISKPNIKEEEGAKKREETFNQSNLASATTGAVSASTAAAAAASKSIEIPQPEKMTLLKSLTNFWADRSATLWDPLEYPLESHEHTFADSDVIVRDDEPSSLVAFCLSSNDYKQKLEDMGKETDLSSGFDLENNEINNKKINNFSRIEKKFKKKNFTESTTLEKIMVKHKSNHLKYQFVDGNTNLSCKIFYSEQFEAFRRACGNHDNFIQSLSRCIKWNSSGGKSGSNFLKTLDDRYIVKELSKSELESFVSIAPFYFKYISQSMFNTLSTAIAKIFGFYQIQIKNTITGKTYKMDFLIMENLFYNHKTTRIFDLKGSMRNRHVKQTGKENEVLLDENMIEYIYESPVFVKEQSKKLLRGSLFNDTSFLSAMDVMDYSLVIGIDSSTKKLYIGIIDWLRTFTWDKKVENWVKGNNLIGGNKKGKDPTIVTPKQYRTRFREAMERYLLEVPDIWYEGAKNA